MREFTVTVFENNRKELVVDRFCIEALSAVDALNWVVDVDDLNPELVSVELS